MYIYMYVYMYMQMYMHMYMNMNMNKYTYLIHLHIHVGGIGGILEAFEQVHVVRQSPGAVRFHLWTFLQQAGIQVNVTVTGNE